jgi:hypothetical protein
MEPTLIPGLTLTQTALAYELIFKAYGIDPIEELKNINNERKI